MIALLKKELWSYFSNWTAWFIIASFGLICSLFLFVFENDYNIFDIGSASLLGFFQIIPWLLLFIIPAISMKSLAEERQNGTLQWLFSQPISLIHLLLAKFLNTWVLGIFCLTPSLFFLGSVYFLGTDVGNLDWGMTLGAYIGSCLLIGGFAALGILASSLAKNQINAFLIGFFFNFFFYFGIHQLASYRLLGKADFVLQNLGFQSHFVAFSRGLIDTRDVFYFVLVITLSLFAAQYFLQQTKK